MVATYPASARLFPARVDVVDVIFAEHVNLLQEEMSSVQAYLGLLPHVSTTPSAAGTFIASSSIFASVAARLANIETGIVADSHTQYLKKVGGETIVPSAVGVRGLSLRARAGQTAPLLRVEGSDGVVGYLEVTTSGATVTGTLAVSGQITEAGVRPYSSANPPPTTAIPFSDALPSVGSRTAGVATTASRGDHSHGASSTRGFSMTIMGS